MVYRDNCAVCGECYTEENLLACATCGRDFCYRCGDWGTAECNRCRRPSPDPVPADRLGPPPAR
jgi:hypothetical protein